jgi:hypothetical protein
LDNVKIADTNIIESSLNIHSEIVSISSSEEDEYDDTYDDYDFTDINLNTGIGFSPFS